MQEVEFNSKKERLDYLHESCLGSYADILQYKGFLDAPASTRFHGNYAGGLFDHSANVASVLVELTEKLGLEWEREESPVMIGMLHDLCKIDQYIFDRDKDMYVFSNDPVIKGHGMKSVIYIQGMGIRLTEEETACIVYHMGAFCPEKEWNDYGQAVERYPNVLWTHTADMVASKIMEV